MISLTISEQDPTHIELLAQLEGLSLSRKICRSQDVDEPILQHKDDRYRGFDAIHAYLIDLKKQVNSFPHFYLKAATKQIK